MKYEKESVTETVVASFALHKAEKQTAGVGWSTIQAFGSFTHSIFQAVLINSLFFKGPKPVLNISSKQ